MKYRTYMYILRKIYMKYGFLEVINISPGGCYTLVRNPPSFDGLLLRCSVFCRRTEEVESRLPLPDSIHYSTAWKSLVRGLKSCDGVVRTLFLTSSRV